jgi:hypothetical protein
MLPIGQYATFTSPFFILSVTKKYHKSRCFVWLLLDVLPFSASSIVPALSWSIVVVGAAMPWAARKCLVHSIWPILLLLSFLY